MKIFENKILSFEEKLALEEYIHNPNWNAFMTSKLSNREKSGKIGSVIPRDDEDFKYMLEQILLVYSAILKTYYNGSQKQLPKFVYRGVRREEKGESFLSTSTDIGKATSFCYSKSKENILYKIQVENIPFINLEELGENEILFPPALLEESTEFEITEEEKEKINAICEKKQIPSITYKTVKLKTKDLSIGDNLIELDDLCEQYDSYLENIKALKNLNPDTLEYKSLAKKLETYKQQIHQYLESQFYKINNDVLKQNTEHYKNGLEDCMQDSQIRTSTTLEATKLLRESILKNEKTSNIPKTIDDR